MPAMVVADRGSNVSVIDRPSHFLTSNEKFENNKSKRFFVVRLLVWKTDLFYWVLKQGVPLHASQMGLGQNLQPFWFMAAF